MIFWIGAYKKKYMQHLLTGFNSVKRKLRFRYRMLCIFGMAWVLMCSGCVFHSTRFSDPKPTAQTVYTNPLLVIKKYEGRMILREHEGYILLPLNTLLWNSDASDSGPMRMWNDRVWSTKPHGYCALSPTQFLWSNPQPLMQAIAALLNQYSVSYASIEGHILNRRDGAWCARTLKMMYTALWKTNMHTRILDIPRPQCHLDDGAFHSEQSNLIAIHFQYCTQSKHYD